MHPKFPRNALQAAQSQPVYADGLKPGWSFSTLGATLNNATAFKPRPGTNYSLNAVVRPFGMVSLASIVPFNATQSVLEAFCQGSVLGKASLQLRDLNGGRVSSSLLLPNTPDSENPDIVRLLGPDESGWFRVQVNLQALTANASTVTSPFQSPDLWDIITLTDVSGTGFRLVLSEMSIVTIKNTATNASEATSQGGTQCVGSACSPYLVPTDFATPLVPLYGGDVVATADGSSPVIAKLAPGTTKAQVAQLCAEMGGHLVTPFSNDTNTTGTQLPRFNATCVPDSANFVAVDVNPTAPVDWPFLAIKAATEEDLKAMRAELVGTVTYFDRDKKASINRPESLSSGKVEQYKEAGSSVRSMPRRFLASENLSNNANSSAIAALLAQSNASLPVALPLPQPTAPLNAPTNEPSTTVGMSPLAENATDISQVSDILRRIAGMIANVTAPAVELPPSNAPSLEIATDQATCPAVPWKYVSVHFVLWGLMAIVHGKAFMSQAGVFTFAVPYILRQYIQCLLSHRGSSLPCVQFGSH